MPHSKHDGGKRVVVCALSTYGKIGGLQNFNRRLFHNLDGGEAGGGEAVVFLLGDSNATIPRLPGAEILAPRNRLFYFMRAFWRAATQGRMLLVCHLNLLPLAAAIRLFRPRLPIVLFVHGYEAWNSAGRPRRLFERLAARSVDRVVSVSRFTAEVMSREFRVPLRKFRILPNAVDRLESAPSGGRRPLSILTVTRLGAGEREKNVDEMIEAFALLRQSVPDAVYEIIGDGALRPGLEALAQKLGVADAVTFRGLVPAKALQEAYASASVFAMPSDKEGFGIVYLEAWQYGLPVICSKHGAASEVVSDGVDGFVVDPKDVPALAARLRQLLLDEGLAKAMGERGREKVEAKYLNAEFRARLLEILDECRRESDAGAFAGPSKSAF
ncbi:glycosyltransferase family 4 protein [Methylocella sp.]|uniref:glycosyltransferase family 4 protein n=1 Tax=Methylocella sp. TaxID=1978226 RepID=UPI0037850A7C